MKNHIPDQHQGGKLDTTAIARFPSEEEAKAFYQIAKSRLLNVSCWAEICKVPLSTFTLTDKDGHEVIREAEPGDYLKIDIPGPGTYTGEGFDWVCIEKVDEEINDKSSAITLQARPSANPTAQSSSIAHFFTSQATSTFQVKQTGNTVSAEEHGRNEVPNTDTSHLTDNIRNTLVGWTAKIGLSYPQWKSLVRGIVETNLS
ncbi:hypothetical protein TH53_05810 [Pedobacter lusitanus]|uniref:Uncharacterized protein n=1 Tax=Pedobacter lusitanus TaxID=1503925 RepID=A0A0D0FZW9_9SPHI|nr:hypothetical protein [Pedobacter lusitanus]KIO78104.1 hypothetical protein TH53_05810 [Pedobacter lusitanus]